MEMDIMGVEVMEVQEVEVLRFTQEEEVRVHRGVMAERGIKVYIQQAAEAGQVEQGVMVKDSMREREEVDWPILFPELLNITQEGVEAVSIQVIQVVKLA